MSDKIKIRNEEFVFIEWSFAKGTLIKENIVNSVCFI